MTNLTEQIAVILATLRHRIETEDDDFHYDAVIDARRQLVNTFKAEVDKLTVIGDEEISNHLYRVSTSKYDAFTEGDGTLVNPNIYSHVRIKELLKAQLQHTKQKLLDIMEE